MTISRLLTLALLVVTALCAAPALRAQDGSVPALDPTNANAPVDTSASSLVAEYELDYDNVFKIVKTTLAELGYPENYASKKRSLIETAFKQLATADDFFEVMGKLGEVPYIRSPGWTIGRAKLMVNFEKLENGKIGVKVLGQLSGYEDRFTNIWHYWKSNGKIEQEAMDAINAAVDREISASAPAGATNNQ